MKVGLLFLALSLTVSACSTGNPETMDVSSDSLAVTRGLPLYFSSGVGANLNDGDTMKAQALGAMTRLGDNINTAGLGLGEVVFVRAYLAPGPDGRVDYAGWNEAWGEIFDDESGPQVPARTTVAVPLLGQPGRFIELEYVVVTREGADMAAGSEALALPVTNPNLKPYGTRTDRIYSGMGVMPGGGMYWTVGMTAPVLNADAEPSSSERRGDMFTQSRNTLLRLKDNLADVGLTLADVVYVRRLSSYIRLRQANSTYEGWNDAYGELVQSVCGTAWETGSQLHRPRGPSACQGALIEMEFIAAKPSAAGDFQLRSEAGHSLPQASGVHGVGSRVRALRSAWTAAKRVKRHSIFHRDAVPTVGGDVKYEASFRPAVDSGTVSPMSESVSRMWCFSAPTCLPLTKTSTSTGGRRPTRHSSTTPGQPHKSARTTIQVHSLPNADWEDRRRCRCGGAVSVTQRRIVPIEFRDLCFVRRAASLIRGVPI